MARPPGRRNADFEAKRLALARRARDGLLLRGAGVSLRELAETIGVSVHNLQNYFGGRDGLICAIAEVIGKDAEPILLDIWKQGDGDLENEVWRYVDLLLLGWRTFGVGRMFVVGLGEGLGDERRGAAVVDGILEPTLQSAERALDTLIRNGLLSPQDTRAAALSLVAPVVLALLHQDGLNGVTCRPLNVDAFARQHVTRWTRGHR
jgi:AcrR family transcriptional regulator